MKTDDRIVVGLNTCIHRIEEGGWCPDCQARIDAAKAGVCLNCKKRPATVNWTADGGVLAFTHGMSERWCERCCIEAQLAHAQKMAARIPTLERGLRALMGEPESGLRGDPVGGTGTEDESATKDSSSSPPNFVVPEAESGPQDALHRELLLWLDDREINDQFERIGEKFYAETGFLLPGKAEPIDMCGGEEHAQHRQKAWRDWCAQWRLSLIERLSAALLVPAAPRSAQHGRDCPKVPHVGGGYLHDADDDRPYEVDRVAYCGRCHCWLESPFIPAAPPENKDDDLSRLLGVPGSEHGDPREDRNEPNR